MGPAYTCECEADEGEVLPRAPYRVTGHDGSIVVCCYCQDCADLAAIDWNGETAAIEPIAEEAA